MTVAVMVASPPLPLNLQHSTRALAHQVEVEKDVGATLHIEPSDTPRAGEAVLAWFALTRKGGQPISLEDCDCTLAVYTRSQATPILEPGLKAVEAEGYEGIPGATFTFPDVGAYTLVIMGKPKQANDFTPFELDFEVTVAAGAAVPRIPEDASSTLPAPTDTTDTAESPAPSVAPKVQSSNTSRGIVMGLSSVVLLGISATLLLRSRQKS